ncbi:TrbC/VirB2 family protein [Luteibacter yeojuensis]|uniref:Type IV secretion system protein VirB2 n=1 Tax=Luteibacter yeojuensis TaxID=345309 RepID=A0A0F3KX61_9GAMM|nr:TrbC/VirB2 family protein [Luteibacter yeojuensis]KJV35813.1 hypothetical protein VI08_07480 [Luteibacter yeojuensis]
MSVVPKRHVAISVVRLLVLLCALLPVLAFAAEGGPKDTLPYEDGLQVLYTSLTGPVPFAISLVGIVACGAMLIFGGEISGFMRTLVFIVLVVAVIVQAASVVTLLGGTNKFSSVLEVQNDSPQVA